MQEECSVCQFAITLSQIHEPLVRLITLGDGIEKDIEACGFTHPMITFRVRKRAEDWAGTTLKHMGGVQVRPLLHHYVHSINKCNSLEDLRCGQNKQTSEHANEP